MVFDPVGVPPFLGVDLDAVELHGEVDVIAAGHAGHAAEAHGLAAFDGVSDFDVDAAEVAVDGVQAVAVVDDDAVAVDAEGGGVDDDAVVRGLDAHVLGSGEVVAEVDLAVDLLAVVEVGAVVGEGGFGFGGLAGEGLGEEEVVGGFGLEVGEGLVVGFAHAGVDLDETGDGVAGAGGV